MEPKRVFSHLLWGVLITLAACSLTPSGSRSPVPNEALNADVQPETINQTICVPGYAASVRPSSAYTNSVKRKLMGERFHEWTAQTAFIPFTRGLANPGLLAIVGGTLLFLIATWAHPTPAGFWRWVG